MGLFGRSKSLVGLDIGSSAIKLVELKDRKKGQGYELVNFGYEPLSAEAIVDGTIMDAGLVVETIKKLYADTKCKNKDVATSLSGHSVIIKRISLQQMDDAALSESITWEAEQYIPFDIEEVSIDFQRLSGQPNEEGNMDVLLAAVKKEKIQDYTDVIRQADLAPKLVDIDIFAVQNAYELNHEISSGEIQALINVGASVTNIAVMKGPQPIFWRDISVGGNHYTEAIQKELSLSYDQAERLKKGQDVEGIPLSNAYPIISSVSEEIGNEIQKTIDFFKATTVDEPVNRIILSGGSARTIGFSTYLGERFEAPVELMDPLRRIAKGRDLNVDRLDDVAPALAVAVGLAIRFPGDKQ
jgi:type IV pilus assembly protein PilM